MKRLRYNSPVILTFAIIALVVLGINSLIGNSLNHLLFSVYRSSWADPFAYIRVFSHVLGHGSLTHYVNNFLLILLVGPMLEERYGSKNILVMILITALITGIVSLIVAPNVALLGASGIVFMLILLSSFTSIQKGEVPVTLILVVGLYMGREIAVGLANVTGLVADNVSQIAHITGGICGVGFGFLIPQKKAD